MEYTNGMKWFRTGCYAVAMFGFAVAAMLSPIGADRAVGFTLISVLFGIGVGFSTGAGRSFNI